MNEFSLNKATNELMKKVEDVFNEENKIIRRHMKNDLL